MSLQNAKQTDLYQHLDKDDEPTIEELEREREELLQQQKQLTHEIIQLSQHITRKKTYREYVK